MGAEPIDLAFAALAHPVRRAMLDRLLSGELTIGELSAPFPIQKPTISRHIRTLEEAGLIERTVIGRTHRCRVSSKGIRELRTWLDRYERFWSLQLDQLDQFLNASAERDPGAETGE